LINQFIASFDMPPRWLTLDIDVFDHSMVTCIRKGEKRLMAHDGNNASTAARAVGYESPSQFRREFKRFSG